MFTGKKKKKQTTNAIWTNSKISRWDVAFYKQYANAIILIITPKYFHFPQVLCFIPRPLIKKSSLPSMSYYIFYLPSLPLLSLACAYYLV